MTMMGDCGVDLTPSPLTIGRNRNRNLEIPLVAQTELGSDLSDLDLTLRFSDHCRNALLTTCNDWGMIYCRNISDNQNKHYIVGNVSEEMDSTLSHPSVAAEPAKIGKRL